MAAHSVPAVMAAQPIEPLPNEQLKGYGPKQLETHQLILHSPKKQNLQDFLRPTFDEGYMRSAEARRESVEDAQCEEGEA